MAFENNVFINCPFDDEYRLRLMRPLLFTVRFLRYEPKFARNKSSGKVRIQQIKDLIRESKFGIHDLSRSRYEIRQDAEPQVAEESAPRFNMPYELGLDVGCCEYGNRKLQTKVLLVLERETDHYDKVLSDFSGQDISAHHDDPFIMIEVVRNWFELHTEEILPSAEKIWRDYNTFTANFEEELAEEYSEELLNRMPNPEFLKYINNWLDR